MYNNSIARTYVYVIYGGGGGGDVSSNLWFRTTDGRKN